ncbi:hypothetical protein PCANC_22211 [Puccinia coronata f. sp. avenae]|uniref:Uncharacterized protein n=1 Tax=Puccinia coronata f. sp. avenae TaxID=200324 RepID=A0A2N5SJK2_9BASI|nr:hypothetical protein PCANC_22211 [Puccinia coronata f. sp. avenae]
MLPSSDAYPASVRAPPNAAPPPFKDLYFDSNGVLFRNGVAVVDQHGSLIRRSIVEQPPPTPVAPENLVSLLLFHFSAIMYTDPARISGAALQSRRDRTCCAPHFPPVFDPYPAFVESRSVPPVFQAYPRGPVPPGLESLPEHLHHNGPGATNASEDAQMSSANRGRLVGDPARIAEATRVFNEAHDLIVDYFYNTAAPPVPCPASEPRAPTTDPIDTDSDPADTQSEPLLTNDQGDPVSTTYPFTNFSRPATPNPPGFLIPKITIGSTTIKSTHSFVVIMSRPYSIASPSVLNILPISTNPPCPPWCRTTPNSLLATEPSAPTACKPSSSSPALSFA